MAASHIHAPDGYVFAEPGTIEYGEYAAVYRHGAGWEPPSERAWDGWQRHGSMIIGVRQEDTSKLVGTGSLQPLGSRMFLSNLVVVADHRGRGIGKSLVDARVELADNLGIETTRTSLSAFNTIQEYYAAHGFVPEVGTPYHVRQHPSL